MFHDDENDIVEHTLFSFTLTLSAPELTDDISNAIYQLGIEDALVGQADGSVFVDFVVEDTCLADAIINMIEKVESALPGVAVTGVHPPGEAAIADANAYLRMRNNSLKNRIFHR